MRLVFSRPVQVARKLLYSALLIAPLLSYTTESNAIPRGEKPTQSRSIKATSCKFKKDSFVYTLSGGKEKILSDLLVPGEKVQGVKCNDNYAFILTNSSLIAVPGAAEKTDHGRLMLELNHVKNDMNKVFKEGLVAWAIGKDRCFFLVRSGRVWEVPAITKESTLPVYSLPDKVSKADMVFHSGFLFIAPVGGKMIVMKITDEARYVELGLSGLSGDSKFFYKSGSLFYGKGIGEKVEVEIKGNKPSDVRIIKK